MATDSTLFAEQLALFVAEIEGLKELREGDETTDVEINGETRASYNKYIKSLTDEQFASISALIENVMTFETLAELELVTSPTIVSPATTVGAKVLNDSTLENNGWYAWDVSASEWVLSAYGSILDEVTEGSSISVSSGGVFNALTTLKKQSFASLPLHMNDGYINKTTGATASRLNNYYSDLIEIASLGDYITVDFYLNYSTAAHIAYYDSATLDAANFVSAQQGTLNTQNTRIKLEVPDSATHFSLCGYSSYMPKVEYMAQDTELSSLLLSTYATYNFEWVVKGFVNTLSQTPTYPAVSENDVYIPTENGSIFGLVISDYKKHVLLYKNDSWSIGEIKNTTRDLTLNNTVLESRSGTDLSVSASETKYSYAIEKNTLFDYEGDVFVVSSTDTTDDYVDINGGLNIKSMLDNCRLDSNSDGTISIILDMACSATADLTIQPFVVNSTVDTQTISFIADTPKTVIFKCTITDPLVEMTQLRFRVNDLIDGYDLSIGRIGFITNVAEPIEHDNFLPDVINNKIKSAAVNNEGAEIGGFYGWDRTTGYGVFELNEGQDCVLTQEADHPFNYSGNAAVFTGKAANEYGDISLRAEYSDIQSQPSYTLTDKGTPASLNLELYSDIDDTITISYTSYGSNGTLTRTVGEYKITAGEIKRITAAFYIEDNDNNILIKLERTGQNLKIGRMGIYLKRGVSTLDSPLEVAKLATRLHEGEYHSLGLDQEYWGDSLTARITDFVVDANPDITVNINGFGGETSVTVAQLFLETTPDTDKFYIFWVGRNNYSETQNILTDVKRMVAHCGSSNYLVMGVINGNYSGEYLGGTNYHYFADINDKLKAAYGERFFDVRDYLIQSCEYGSIFLEGSFTQPAVSSNVSITVNDSSHAYYEVGKQIVIGMLDSYLGTYTIQSIDDATTITVRLDSEGTLSTGSTFTYAHSYDLETEIYDFSDPQQILAVSDVAAYANDIPSDYYRSDDIHINSYGNVPLAARIRQIINAL